MGDTPENGLSSSTCLEVFSRLEDYLDRELSADEIRIVEDHLALCEVCASEFRFEESVLSGLKQRVRSGGVPETLKGRVTSMLDRIAAGDGQARE